MRRVLHLRTVVGKGGGPEKTLLNSPRFLCPDYELRLAYVRPARDPEYDMPSRARRAGVSLLDVPEVGPLDPRSLVRLARDIRRFRPHLLHAHDYKTNLLAVLLKGWFRLPIITTVHGYVTLGGRLDLYYRLDRWALRRMEHVIAVSPDLDGFLAELGVNGQRRTMVENGVDTEEYRRREPRAAAKQRMGLDPGRLLIGAVGRLQPEKGFSLLLTAVSGLFAEGLDFDVVIAGEGPERERLQAQIRQIAGGERIRLLGYCGDPVGLYHAMDIFVLSSLREGLPNVLLEAMALEVPVLATRVAGVPRLIEAGRNGMLVSPGDADSLRAALRELTASAEFRTRLAGEARQTIEAQYSFAARMQKVRQIYDRLLGPAERVAR